MRFTALVVWQCDLAHPRRLQHRLRRILMPSGAKPPASS
jgi:hypothetical protein